MDSSQYVVRMYEKWDTRQLPSILQRKAVLDAGDYGCLSDIWERYDHKHRRTLQVDYTYAKDSGNQGRLYGSGYQRCPGWIRRICAHEYYHDIDIENCYPVLLLQIAQEFALEVPKLKEFVENREALFAEDMENLNLTRSQVKQRYLKVMFGGVPGAGTTILSELSEEIKSISRNLMLQKQFVALRESAERRVAERRAQKRFCSLEGSFISRVIQLYEKKCIDVAVSTFKANGWQVDVLVFDGFMVRKRDDVELTDMALKQVNEEVLNLLGLRVDFVAKSLKPTQSDYNKLYGEMNNFDLLVHQRVTSEMAMTSLRALENRLHRHETSEETATLFADKGLEILSRSYARVGGIKPTVAKLIHTPNMRNVDYLRITPESFDRDMRAYLKFSFALPDEPKRLKIDLLELWLASKPLYFEGVTFNPRPHGHPQAAPPNLLNLFTGHDYRPTELYSEEEVARVEAGPLKLWVQHLTEIWAQSDAEIGTYCKFFMAALVKMPWRKLHAALALKSAPGAGKGILLELVIKIIGSKYCSKPTSLEELNGKGFNANLVAGKTFAFLDECYYAGCKRTKNALKSMQTAETINVKKKFVPDETHENFLNIAAASNEDHVVNIDSDQRRWAIVRLSDKFKGNHKDDSEAKAYFDALAQTDVQILCNYFHSLPVQAWNEKDIPLTAETAKQVEKSLEPIPRFLRNFANDPTLYNLAKVTTGDDDDRHDPAEGSWRRDILYELFKKEVSSPFKPTHTELWQTMKQVFKSVQFPRNARFITDTNGYSNVRKRVIVMPPMRVLRREFIEAYRQEKAEDIFD